MKSYFKVSVVKNIIVGLKKITNIRAKTKWDFLNHKNMLGICMVVLIKMKLENDDSKKILIISVKITIEIKCHCPE